MLAIYIGTILFIYIYGIVVWAFPPCVGPCALPCALPCLGAAAAPPNAGGVNFYVPLFCGSGKKY